MKQKESWDSSHFGDHCIGQTVKWESWGPQSSIKNKQKKEDAGNSMNKEFTGLGFQLERGEKKLKKHYGSEFRIQEIFWRQGLVGG